MSATITREEIPNLDCILMSDLWSFAEKIGDSDRPRCFGLSMDDYRNALHLRHYALTKMMAIHLRLRGDIDNALEFEAECNRIYKDLSDWAKW